MGDSRHTPNIQIDKVIGENKKCVFYIMEKTKQTLWPTQYFLRVKGEVEDSFVAIYLFYFRKYQSSSSLK